MSNDLPILKPSLFDINVSNAMGLHRFTCVDIALILSIGEMRRA